MRFGALLCGLVVAAGFGRAHAVDGDGAFAIKGIAAERCQAFSEAYQNREESVLIFVSWVEGYLTAFNRFREQTFDAAPWQSPEVLLFLIHNHCQQVPDDQLSTVVHELLNFLGQDRLTQLSELERATVGERSVTLYREIMRRVQQQLVDEGYLGGGVDGQFGPNTQSAIEAYQEANNLAKTGLPDQDTLFRMFIGGRAVAAQAPAGEPSDEPAPGLQPDLGLSSPPNLNLQ